MSNVMEDRLPTRPFVLRAVRLLSQPRRSAADSALVTGVALRLAALDSDTDTAERLIAAADRVITSVSGLTNEPAPAADWSDTAEALALMIAGRPLQRRHLMASRSTLGSADKVLDLSDRLRRTAEEPVDRDDLGRALAMAITGTVELIEALAGTGESGPSRPSEPRMPSQSPRAARSTPTERSVSLRALDGGLPGR